MASSNPRPDLRRRIAGSALLAAVALLGTVTLAHAQTGLPAGNSELPINLEAASSDFDYKNNTLLFKRVKITQGGLEVTAQQASATGLEFNNSEWRLQGDVQITVPGGKLQSSEARVMFWTTRSPARRSRGRLRSSSSGSRKRTRSRAAVPARSITTSRRPPCA